MHLYKATLQIKEQLEVWLIKKKSSRQLIILLSSLKLLRFHSVITVTISRYPSNLFVSQSSPQSSILDNIIILPYHKPLLLWITSNFNIIPRFSCFSSRWSAPSWVWATKACGRNGHPWAYDGLPTKPLDDVHPWWGGASYLYSNTQFSPNHGKAAEWSLPFGRDFVKFQDEPVLILFYFASVPDVCTRTELVAMLCPIRADSDLYCTLCPP